MEILPGIKIKLLSKKARIPNRSTEGAVGYDLHAAESLSIKPYALSTRVKLGFALELPHRMEMEIRGRSGMNSKSSMRVVHGTIDFDYRGEVGVIIDNLSDEAYIIEAGDRIAQGVFHYVGLPVFEAVAELIDTRRGAGGFGHTGK